MHTEGREKQREEEQIAHTKKNEKCTPNPNLEAQAFKTFCRLQHGAGRLMDC